MTRFVSLAIALFSFTGATFGKGHEIKATVRGVKDAMCQLAYYYGDKQYIRDSAKADSKGMVVFKGDEELPGGIYMLVIPGRKYFELILDKEQRFSLETDTTDLINKMVIKGSKDNEQFYDYLKWINVRGRQMESLKAELDAAKSDPAKTAEIKARQTVIDNEVKDYKANIIKNFPEALLSKIFKAGIEPEIPEMPTKPDGSKDSTFPYRYFRAHYFDNLDLKDDRLIRTPIFASKVKQYIERLVPQIPDSICKASKELIAKTDPNGDIFKYLVYWITNTYEKSNVMGMDAVFVCMSEEYYLTDKAYWIDSTQRAKIKDRVYDLKPCLIGKTAYNMKLLKPDFHPIAVNDLKSSYTILYFWDPSCGHCQKITPKLHEFYTKYKQELDLEVMGVYIETDTTEWFKYIREKGLTWVNAADLTLKSRFRDYYDIYSTPVIYVLDRNKRIIAKRIDVENLEEFIRNYRKKPMF